MTLTFFDILHITALSNYIEITGTKGLSKPVKRISVIDSPVNKADFEDSNIILPGDIYITNLYAVKDNEMKMMELVEMLNDLSTSGLIVVDQFVKKIPVMVAQYSEIHNFPIVLINENISYGDIIKEVMELILTNKVDKINEMIIDQIIKTNSDYEVIQLCNKLNPKFYHHYYIFYVKTKYTQYELQSFRNLMKKNSQTETTIFTYGLGFCIFFTHGDKMKPEVHINYIVSLIRQNFKEAHIGISNQGHNLKFMKKYITEAIDSCKTCSLIQENVVFYKNAGIYRLLLPLAKSSELKDFIDNILDSLIDFDKKNNANLFKTAIIFVQWGGNVKKTGKALFIHENTVRYRISKIKELLSFENSDNEFYVFLYIAVEGYKIRKYLNEFN